MHVEWYGQAAFRLSTRDTALFIDPIGDVSAIAGRGLQFDFPAIENVSADLVLVTHEHFDHNGVDGIVGASAVLRSTAGRLQSPIGEVIAIASEHDRAAGIERGPNTVFVFSFDDVRVCHFGDFGQSALRPEQRAAIGAIDLLFIPVGGGPTIGASEAASIIEQLAPRWVVPMHYRTPRIGFLETAEPFLALMPNVHRLDRPAFDLSAVPTPADGPSAIVPASP
jgi:L-ascorbate metabolism protein UlaG (beta-lactamase superfamily)